MFQTLDFIAHIGAWLASLGAIAVGAIIAGIYIPGLRLPALAVVIVSLSSGFFLAKGVHLEQVHWQQAEQQTVETAKQVRAEAEHDVASGTVGRGSGSLGLRHGGGDKYDRDGGAVRGVAGDHVQQPARHVPNRPANPSPQPSGTPVGVLGVIKPSENYPCWRVQQAFAALSKEAIATLSKDATPAQREAARKCLEARGVK